MNVNFSAIKNVITSKIARQILVTQKNSPTILFGVGVVGVVATVVVASKATLKLDDTLDDTQAKLELASEVRGRGQKNYTENDYRKDVAVVYVRSAGSIAKLYAPAFVVGVASIAALSGSHVILSKRNVGLTAAYAVLEKGFAEYRGRVLQDVGADKEREYHYGLVPKEIVEETEEGTKVRTVMAAGAESSSPYAVWFDDFSANWSKDPEYNRMFLQAQQNYANQRLHAHGYLLLNDVYVSLGIKRSKAGCVVGWVMGQGDNFVDFNIFGTDSDNRVFVNRFSDAVLLDFNVDGIIYDKI